MFLCVPQKATTYLGQLLYVLGAPALGGPKGIFRRLSAQIGIIQVKVDGLERSSQHRNMHRLSTCDRGRRLTDTVPQPRSQISEV